MSQLFKYRQGSSSREDELESKLRGMNYWSRVHYLKQLPREELMRYVKKCWNEVLSLATIYTPYFVPVLTKLRVIVNENLEAPAAISGKTIIINPYLWCSFGGTERFFLILHELMHGLAQHPVRGSTWIESKTGQVVKRLEQAQKNVNSEAVADALHELLNIVYDAYINDLLLNLTHPTDKSTRIFQPSGSTSADTLLRDLLENVGIYTREKLSKRTEIPVSELEKRIEEEVANMILDKMIQEVLSFRTGTGRESTTRIKINVPKLLDKIAQIAEAEGMVQEAEKLREAARACSGPGIKIEDLLQVLDLARRVLMRVLFS